MKKMYWWRVIIMLIGIIIFCYSYIASYNDELGLCKIADGLKKCMISHNGYIDSLGFLSLAIIIVVSLTFFISDIVFKKWFRFALIWVFFTIFLIIITPEYQREFISLPDRELVSIWMGSLFVIISITLLAYQSYKLRKK